MALIADFQRGKRGIWAGELSHRGEQIKDALQSRRALRRGRRNRHTRYRPARFLNRRRPKGWLPPPTRTVVVPDYKELDRGTLRSIIRQPGLSVDEYLHLLG